MSELAQEIEHVVGVPLPHEVSNNGAIPVRIVGNPSEDQAAAAFASYRGYVFTGTEPPMRLLPQDNKRHRAVVQCVSNGAPGTTQFVFLCRQAQVSNQTTLSSGGFVLASGNSLVIESSSEVWIIPASANGACIVSVLDERYA